MAVLNEIYTKTGDKGETALGNGQRVAKHSARVNAYGTVDEVNATVGLARQRATGEIGEQLSRIQNICSIWALIFAAPTWKKMQRPNIHRCA